MRPGPARITALAPFALLLSMIATSPGMAQEAANTVRMVPHEARYDVSLLELRSANKGSAGGIFLVRVARSCDGWSLDSDLQVQIETQEGGATLIESRSRYEEILTEAGGRLIFRQSQSVDGTPLSATAGEARRGPEGGEARFERPAGTTLSLPPDTAFPVSGSLNAMRRLFGGEKMVSQMLFDGGEDGALLTVDLAAGTPEPAPEGVRGDRDLLRGRMLRTVTAFYAPDQPDSEPLSTYVSDMYDNGVAARLSIDVGLATIDAELSAIRRLPDPEC
ncbi:EipB family protein [Marivibrio halodurans]|nr:DUF1849 family protein [Marivibrio halodurans]